ncbi:MAG: HNH endonuclease [Chloroflexota bacterium]
MTSSLADCLNLTEAAARQQWRRIAARHTVRRQEAYLPVELILCIGLFQKVNPHQFGGANLHKLPPEVRALAATFKRTDGSITNKMLNLEGFRAHGAKIEVQLFLRLGQQPDHFAHLYLEVVKAARREGFDGDHVPDFLNWLDAAPQPDLIGQDELGSREIAVALNDNTEEIRDLQRAYDFGDLETSRIVEQRVRLRQHVFASAVVAQYQHRCAFCGFDASALRGRRLLVASHIKPWAASTNRERLDSRNGIAACAIHDSAFDTGLLTVQADLTVRRAPSLEAVLQPDTAAERLFGPDTLRTRLLVPPDAPGPRAAYLIYHARHVYRG